MISRQNVWLLSDALLAVVNLFNCFAIFCHVHPVESPLKKVSVKLMHDVIKPVRTTPFLESAVLLAFIAIAYTAGLTAYEGGMKDVVMAVRAVCATYSFIVTSLLIKLTESYMKLGVDKMLDRERELEKHDIVSFQPPSELVANALLAPMRPFLRTDATGIDRIPPKTPHLFVMNHSLYGIEMPLFVETLYKETGIYARGLADHIHFATPHGPILRNLGAVNGTRENVDVLMEAKKDILVYPGGGQEVLKHSSVPRYELMWKQRLGFARLAIKHGYPILPCAAVGTEDMLETIVDIPLEFVRKGQNFPIAVTHPGKVQKIYFWFGDPIPTAQYKGAYENDDFAREVRDKTKAAIKGGIKELKERQANDPDRFLMDEFTAWLKKAFENAFKMLSYSPTIGFEYNDDDENIMNDDNISKQKKSR